MSSPTSPPASVLSDDAERSPSELSSPPLHDGWDARPGGAPQWARVALVAVLSAVAAGLIAIALALLLEAGEWFFYGVREGELAERVAQAPSWRQVAAPVCAGLLAGLAWWCQRAHGGVGSVEAAVQNPDRDSEAVRGLGILRPFGEAIIQVLTVSGGHSIGRESAPRLAAGAVSIWLSRLLHLDAGWLAILAASTSGAALAAMYNAPLGGAAYAVEIVMLSGMRRRGVLLAIPISIGATAVSWLHSHAQPSIPLPEVRFHPATALAAVLVTLGAFGAGRIARRWWAHMKAHKLWTGWKLPLAIAGAGALTGTVSILLPMIPGNGRDALAFSFVYAEAMDGHPGISLDELGLSLLGLFWALVPLLGIALLKPLLTGATLGAGVTGGLLAPSFSLGAVVGTSVALCVQATGVPVSMAALAALGAAVALGTTQRAPIFAAVFLAEVVRAPWWLTLLLLVSCVAVWGWQQRADLAARWQR